MAEKENKSLAPDVMLRACNMLMKRQLEGSNPYLPKVYVICNEIYVVMAAALRRQREVKRIIGRKADISEVTIEEAYLCMTQRPIPQAVLEKVDREFNTKGYLYDGNLFNTDML